MPGRPGRATVVALSLAVALALGTTALAWMSPNPKENGGGTLAISAGGAMSIDNSREEAAILKTPALAPGVASVGKVTIRNHGKAGSLLLSLRRFVDSPAPGGASLADALEVKVRDLDAGALVYSGRLSTMAPLRLGLLPAGAKRRFRFAARFPESGFVDNRLSGASLRFDYRWRLRSNR